ncbi:hypothetical protein QCA50_014043 [Cerrena zonata]|uniref:Uncharacterized protein n=1 Tax=Cerrena zonata TaxID=2478898 RepID=A0AAW0G0V3_9APHY
MADGLREQEKGELPFTSRTNLQDNKDSKHALRHCVIFILLIYVAFHYDLGGLSKYLSNLHQAYHSIEPVGTVKWETCTYPDTLHNAVCGYIIVPKDYFNASAGTAKIALSKLKATGDRLGTVLYNPGGPGGKAKSLIARRGDFVQIQIGTRYDIIGFDPRGVGETEPTVRCFDNNFTHADFKRNTVLERSYDFATNQSYDEMRDLIIEQEKESDVLVRTQFSRCVKKLGEDLKYMGTSTVVRDIDFITRTLEGEDALINYYGGSYGSILGQYLVNMLPDRVGRVGIDAIADATLWSTKPPYQWYDQWLNQSEKAYNVFLSHCFDAGHEACPLVISGDESPSDIDLRLEAFHDSLFYEPLAVPDAIQPGVLTAGRSRLYITIALEIPGIWPKVAKEFAEAIAGNGTGLLNGISWWNNLIYTDMERIAITCNDVKPFPSPSTEEIVDGYLNVYHKVSRFVFGVVTSEPDAGCQYWPYTPPERFDGPWNHTLRNPMLIISSTADPVTPAGKQVDELMGSSSRLLLHDNPGHAGFAVPSLCLTKHTTAYFEEGILPPEGTICPLDVPLFPNGTNSLSAEGMSIEDSLKLEKLWRFRLILEAARRGLDF